MSHADSGGAGEAVAASSEGKEVLAKWPGTKLWFPAKQVDASGDIGTVMFSDGSVQTIPQKYITDIDNSQFIKPKRSRSRSRSRSRGRSKSPARKTKQSPSPARKSPSRKSPSRPKTPKTPSTPTRRSARLQEKEKEEVELNDKAQVETKAQTPKKGQKAQEKSNYAFGGPVVCFLMVVGLPAFILLLNDLCNKKSCDVRKLPALSRDVANYFNLKAAGVFLGWIAFQAVLAALPVGRVVSGQPLTSGKKLKYRCNGFIAFLITAALFSAAVYFRAPIGFVYANFKQLACVSIVFSFVLSIFVFLKSRNMPKTALSTVGNTGCTVYDFFMGRELNPRIGSFDLKFFFELRPGLIGWAVLNACMVLEAYQKETLTPALMLVAAAQTLYIADALIFEEAILSTMDITTEGFGFMLAFGNVAWVPFIYSLQTRYLLEHPQQWNYAALGAVAFLNFVGYLIFRGSNSQKDHFRQDPYSPALAHLETLPTPSGKKLLVSGWWGLCQHPNYLGDLIMALSWSLYCGFGSVVPYFYPIYFLILLVHRQRRDAAHCRQKHGAAWDRYCERVKYCIFPYIY